MKDLIKELASEQPALKKARKTGTLPKLPPNTWCHVVRSKLPEAINAKLVDSYSAAGNVRRNKAKITAALNIMHELRGSDYRHGYSKNEYLYLIYYRELKEIVANEEISTVQDAK
jgi:hypothetical protein